MLAATTPGPPGQQGATGRMTITFLTRALMALALAACGPQIAVKTPRPADLSSEVIQIAGPGPPAAPKGTCWAHDDLPAVYETETEQSLITAEVRDGAGQIISPATYRSIARLREVSPRRDIWFQAPCPADMTPDFLATLQRALKARGYYVLPLTGVMDQATREALRRYQADHGLDSPLLSLAAARELGLAATAQGRG